MKITTALCRMMYEHLHSTVFVPLKADVVPEWCVTFVLTKDPDAYGWVNPIADDGMFHEYEIEISTVKNKTYKELTETLLHEMCHVVLESKGAKDWTEHTSNSSFEKLKQKVENYTGFNID